MNTGGRGAVTEGDHVGFQALLFFRALRKPPRELLKWVGRSFSGDARRPREAAAASVFDLAGGSPPPGAFVTRLARAGQAPEGGPVVTVSLRSAS